MINQKIEELQSQINSIIALLNSQANSSSESVAARFYKDMSDMRERVSDVVKGDTSLHRAIVTSTSDPLCKGRVQIYSHVLHYGNEDQAKLPWAEVASFFGGLDDQGSVFTPPVGSTVIVLFERGDKGNPIIIGSVRNETRGKDSVEFSIEKEDERWEGTPGVRVDGKNSATNSDPNHLMPPWNNESYNRADGEDEEETDPHIYGIKTPEKHFIQFADGDYKNDLKGKRIVIQSSRGNLIYLKDDVLQSSGEIYENSLLDDFRDGYHGYKYSIRPFGKKHVELRHTGIQFQSFAGGRFIISDETEGNQKSNKWSEGFDETSPFWSFVCLESLTGHQIIMRDSESARGVRSSTNGLFFISASGNTLQLNDHTEGGIGGESRGVLLKSTANHALRFEDHTVDNQSPERLPVGGMKWRNGESSNEEMEIEVYERQVDGKQCRVILESGFGQCIEFNDLGSQTENSNQFLIIRNNNKDESSDFGPSYNFIRMNCQSNNKNFLIWGAGDFEIRSNNKFTRIVHDGDDMSIVQNGNHRTSIQNGHYNLEASKGMTFYSESGEIEFRVGKQIEGKMEFSSYSAVFAKGKGFRCPITKHVHHDNVSKHFKIPE
jgi:hypothetical protein